jgi:phosphatidate cytidylyltransferase
MRDLPLRTVTGVGFGAVVILASLAPWQIFGPILVVVGLVAIWELIRLRHAGFPVLLELIVVVLGLAGLWWLRVLENVVGKPEGIWVPLVLIPILPTWAADIVAYLVGSTVGSRKITPRLSPGKTWEGTIAGFVAAGMVAYAIARVDYAWYAAIFALLVGVVALGGDLLESWVKRRAGVKDSGALFPGHGGMLDRIDSLLAVSILTFILQAPGCCLTSSGMMAR